MDLPDAEEESLALVDAKVLEEEQKLREERKNHASDSVLDDGAELLPWDKY